MLRQTPRIGGNLLGSLHRESIGSPERIWSLLRRAALKGGTLARGFEEQNTGGRASIESLGRHSLVACAPGVGTGDRSQVVFTLFLDGRRYCFVANVISCERPDAVRLSIPTELHVVERRDRNRRVPSARLGDATRLLLLPADGHAVDAEIRDLSACGMGIRTRAWSSWDATRRLRVRHVDGGQAGHELAMAVRNHAHVAGSAGWVRIGLEVAREESGAPLRIDFRPTSRWIAPHRVGRAAGVARRGLSRDVEPKINVVDFKNDRGERIVAIVDSWGETRNAPAVIIPPPGARPRKHCFRWREPSWGHFGLTTVPWWFFDSMEFAGEVNLTMIRDVGFPGGSITTSPSLKGCATSKPQWSFWRIRPGFGPPRRFSSPLARRR